MKRTGFLIVFAMLLMMGCSKDELISDTSENNQLKQGLWWGMKFESISTHDGDYCLTPVIVNILNTEAIAEKKILKNGTFFGSIQGKGKINQNLSYYTIDALIQENYTNYPVNSSQQYIYSLTASGKIFITEKDFCLVNITNVIMIPSYYPAGHFIDHPDELYLARYLGDGIITLHDGQGKFKDFYTTLKVGSGGIFDNDLSTGQLRLKYFEH